ncbi:MAG TPA: RDD family protein [Streptosporangiaceae bacterium]
MAEVVTGEAVVLDVPCASFPSRIGALLIDMVIQLVLLGIVLAVATAGGFSDATVAGIAVVGYVVIVIGYATAFETATRGITPGKAAAGLRVISDDGSPVRFRQALVRALAGTIEIWSWVGAPIGLITALVSARGKRLGDVFAGTYVIQERAPRRPPLPPQLAMVPPPLAGWAQVAETSRLSDQTAEAASSYLRRLGELTPAARDDLGLRLATAVAGQVSPPPPPGTPPIPYLAAVLAIRRQRDAAWLASVGGAGPPGPAGDPAAGLWPGQQAAGWPMPGQQPPGWSAPGQTAPAPASVAPPAPAGTGPAADQQSGSPPPGPAGFAPPG